MNFPALLLALMFGAATVLGKEASPTDNPGVLIAQAAAPGKDRPAAPVAPAPAASDTTTIPAHSAAAQSAPSSGGLVNTMTLWKLIQDGGWAMIPLAFLSVVTVMLVLVYTFTLRRGAILTPHYMNTADVLLKK